MGYGIKMIVAYAWRVPAEVIQLKSIRDSPARYLVRDDVRAPHGARYPELAVAFANAVTTRRPEPARAQLRTGRGRRDAIDLRPETVFDGKMGSHGTDLLCRAADSPESRRIHFTTFRIYTIPPDKPISAGCCWDALGDPVPGTIVIVSVWFAYTTVIVSVWRVTTPDPDVIVVCACTPP